MENKYIKICPICNSPDVSPDLSIPAAVAYGALYNYRCNHCGYIGPIFPEVLAEDLPETKKRDEISKDFPLIDVSYGRGYFKLLKYLSFFGILFYLVLFIGFQTTYSLIGLILFILLSAFLILRKDALKSPFVRIAGLIAILLYAMAFRIF